MSSMNLGKIILRRIALIIWIIFIEINALYTMRHNYKGYKLVDTDTKFFLIIDIAETSCTNNCWEQGQRLCVNCL